jgi:hypothetical protein
MSQQLLQLEQQLLSLTSEQLLAFINTRTFNHAVRNLEYLSLTLVRRTLTSVANTRNKKFRLRYVKELVYYIHNTNYTITTQLRALELLTKLVDTFITDIKTASSASTTYNVRVFTKDNSPPYTPLFVGDSNHWTSCLRLGFLAKGNTLPRDHDSLMALVSKGRMKYTELSKYKTHEGCNSEYVVREVEHFNKGNLFYVGLGIQVYESAYSSGLTHRMRCMFVTLDNATKGILLNRLYGDLSMTYYILLKIRELYPDHILLVPSNLALPGVTTARIGVSIPCNACVDTTYTDYSTRYASIVTKCEQMKSFPTVARRTRQKKSTYNLVDCEGNTLYAHPPIVADERDSSVWKYNDSLEDQVKSNPSNVTTVHVPYPCRVVALTLCRRLGRKAFNNFTNITIIGGTVPFDITDNGITWIGKDRRRYSIICSASNSLQLMRGTRSKQYLIADTGKWLTCTKEEAAQSNYTAYYTDNNKLITLVASRTIR